MTANTTTVLVALITGATGVVTGIGGGYLIAVYGTHTERRQWRRDKRAAIYEHLTGLYKQIMVTDPLHYTEPQIAEEMLHRHRDLIVQLQSALASLEVFGSSPVRDLAGDVDDMIAKDATPWQTDDFNTAWNALVGALRTDVGITD